MSTAQEYNPFRMSWLAIVNYPIGTVTSLEVSLVEEKIREHYLDLGPEPFNIILDQGINFKRARPELILAVYNCLIEHSQEIRMWRPFKIALLKALTDHGYKILIG